MRLWWGILATAALGLVLFVLTNFLAARTSSAGGSSTSSAGGSSTSSGDNGGSWWDWVGAADETEATEEESLVEAVLSYPLDVLRALYDTYAT